MPPLSPDLRRSLEGTISEARAVSQGAAKAALARLGVEEGEPFPHLKPDERLLRNRLRAKGRQLGDSLEARSGRQEIRRLMHEVAYEHWHQMLFARFLAENDLLIHPGQGVAVTLQECKELAAEEVAAAGPGGKGAAKPDLWTVAGRFAARMLPQIFRPDDPALQVTLAPEHRLKLEQLLEGLPRDVFTADDGLGWVYQFWQSERKKEVNASGDKITGETLPAVTQLFTEHYMVLFLLHNTVGAWWAGKVLGKSEQGTANPDAGARPGAKDGAPGDIPEEEWRRRVALPGCTFEYLRFLPDGRPAAGTFPDWPRRAAELRVLDPCCGSGHFLVAVFDLLVRIRMQEDGLSARAACDAVLRENLYGLELDARCTQIAAFALAYAAWKFPDAGGYRKLPPINVACSGLAVAGKKEDWLALANGDAKLRAGLDRLYDLFQQAPELGSLIDPHRAVGGDIFAADFAKLQPLLERALEEEKVRRDAEAMEMGVAALGIAHAAEMLAAKYHLVITNVPYLGRKLHGPVLRAYGHDYHQDAENELATIFASRSFGWLVSGGAVAVVIPQNWLFKTTYRKLRERLLKEKCWSLVVKLGPAAFTDMNWWAANTALLVLTERQPTPSSLIAGLDTSGPRDPELKAALLRGEAPLAATPLARPDAGPKAGSSKNAGRDGSAEDSTLDPGSWASTADASVVLVEQINQTKNPDSRIVVGRRVDGPLLEVSAYSHHGLTTGDLARMQRKFWEVPGATNMWIRFRSTVRQSTPFGGMEDILNWGKTGEALSEIPGARLDGTQAWGRRGVLVSQMRHLPVSLYAGEAFDNNTAAIIPTDARHLPAIWAFCSSLEFSTAVRQIDQAVAVTSATFGKIPFDLARWQKVADATGPLPPPHSDDPTQWLFKGDIPTSTAPLQAAVARLLCYRWPEQPPAPADAADAHVDDDGIACLPVVGKERAAAERLRDLLAAGYGQVEAASRCFRTRPEAASTCPAPDPWTPAKLDQLLAAVGFPGKSLDEWLHDGFFDQHCKLFHHRPFIWHIWDGRKDGFHALLNYHRLDRRLLDKLIYTYLGDWIRRQEDDAKRDVAGADLRLAAARDLQTRLKLIAGGEKPHDIFVRWKPLEGQPIGWEPDLNDGVRLNIRPFVEAGVLRKNSNVNWKKDRGKDPKSAPWYDVFKGERINDHHLSLAEKQEARKAAATRMEKRT